MTAVLVTITAREVPAGPPSALDGGGLELPQEAALSLEPMRGPVGPLDRPQELRAIGFGHRDHAETTRGSRQEVDPDSDLGGSPAMKRQPVRGFALATMIASLAFAFAALPRVRPLQLQWATLWIRAMRTRYLDVPDDQCH